MIMKRFATTAAAAVLTASIPAYAGDAASDRRVAAWAEKAESAKRKGDLSAALVFRRKAAQAAPDDAALRVELAYAYLAVGRHGAASAMFRDAIAMRGPSKDLERGLALAQNELRAADSQRRMLAAVPARSAGDEFAGAETTLAGYLK